MSKHELKKEYIGLSIEEENNVAKENNWQIYVGNSKWEELYDADESCRHLVKGSSGGGVECVKCGGWFCY